MLRPPLVEAADEHRVPGTAVERVANRRRAVDEEAMRVARLGQLDQVAEHAGRNERQQLQHRLWHRRRAACRRWRRRTPSSGALRLPLTNAEYGALSRLSGYRKFGLPTKIGEDDTMSPSLFGRLRNLAGGLLVRFVAAQEVEAPLTLGRRLQTCFSCAWRLAPIAVQSNATAVGVAAIRIRRDDLARGRVRQFLRRLPFGGQQRADILLPVGLHREGQQLTRPVAAVELRLVDASFARDRAGVHRGRRRGADAFRDFVERGGELLAEIERVGHQEVVVGRAVGCSRPIRQLRSGRPLVASLASSKPPHFAAYHSGSLSRIAPALAAGRERAAGTERQRDVVGPSRRRGRRRRLPGSRRRVEVSSPTSSASRPCRWSRTSR